MGPRRTNHCADMRGTSPLLPLERSKVTIRPPGDRVCERVLMNLHGPPWLPACCLIRAVFPCAPPGTHTHTHMHPSGSNDEKSSASHHWAESPA